MPLHAAAAALLAGEAGRPTSGGGRGAGGAIGGGSGGYSLLAAAHTGLAVGCFVAPTALANFLFPGAALPQGFESQALVKLLGCGVGVGAASALGLKQLADSNSLASPTAQRLQLGLMGFSSGGHAALFTVFPAYAKPCVHCCKRNCRRVALPD